MTKAEQSFFENLYHVLHHHWMKCAEEGIGDGEDPHEAHLWPTGNAFLLGVATVMLHPEWAQAYWNMSESAFPAGRAITADNLEELLDQCPIAIDG